MLNNHLDVADVCLRLDHLDCHGGGGLPAHDAAGLRLEHAAEGAGAEEDAEVEPLSGELKLPAGCNVKVWRRWLWLYCLSMAQSLGTASCLWRSEQPNFRDALIISSI